eukprot:4292543-Prymnesium_polylepis.1
MHPSEPPGHAADIPRPARPTLPHTAVRGGERERVPRTGDVTPHRRSFASRNCVISGVNPCERVRTCANPSRIRRELA